MKRTITFKISRDQGHDGQRLFSQRSRQGGPGIRGKGLYLQVLPDEGTFEQDKKVTEWGSAVRRYEVYSLNVDRFLHADAASRR